MSTVLVILPAARLQEQAQQVVDRLHENDSVRHVVLTSPNFEVKNAWCIRDPNSGSARAIAQAYAISGANAFDYIAWLSDICLPRPNALDKMVDFLDQQMDPFIAEFRTWPPVTPGHYRVCTITGRQYARWGMVSRETIAQIGGFFDEAYIAHYGDVDLSLRCWRAGGTVATCTDAIIDLYGHWHVSTAPQSADETLFLERWRHDYPFIRSDNTAEWNVDKEIAITEGSESIVGYE